jgi:hypothetical protein
LEAGGILDRPRRPAYDPQSGIILVLVADNEKVRLAREVPNPRDIVLPIEAIC